MWRGASVQSRRSAGVGEPSLLRKWNCPPTSSDSVVALSPARCRGPLAHVRFSSLRHTSWSRLVEKACSEHSRTDVGAPREVEPSVRHLTRAFFDRRGRICPVDVTPRTPMIHPVDIPQAYGRFLAPIRANCRRLLGLTAAADAREPLPPCASSRDRASMSWWTWSRHESSCRPAQGRAERRA
jgi:hypothetical protein